MNTWTFKSFRRGTCSDGHWQFSLESLTPHQESRKAAWCDALNVAEDSDVPDPVFSEYYVRASIGTLAGKKLPAGNVEYGNFKALHAEECALGAFRSYYRSKDRHADPVFALSTSHEAGAITCCGNCRDLLLGAFGPGLEIVQGPRGGGEAVVSRLADQVLDAFPTIPAGEVPMLFYRKNTSTSLVSSVRYLRDKGNYLKNDVYAAHIVAPLRGYHALIEGGNHGYVGAYDGKCEAHPIYALMDAVRQARRHHDPFIWHVLIACEGGGSVPPDVTYKDRQDLLELHVQGEAVTGNVWDPPVYLATWHGDNVTGLWRTSVKEWLPFPFSPVNFGAAFMEHFTQYHKNR